MPLILRSHPLSLLFVASALVVGFASPASAAIPPPPKHVQGRSVGSPTEGHLIGGARVEETPYLRIVPNDVAGDVRWGLESLVGMVDHAARAVRKQYPDAILSVGHLSRSGGGEIDRHASHESGRDADIGFYVSSATGKPLLAEHFVAFRGDGTAPSWPGAHFDDAKNWAFVAALLADGRAHISYIFVATPLRARLLAYAEKIGAPAAIRSRAAEVMAQPRGSLPHDDHFHVRISCPPGMTGCIEFPTLSRSARARRAHANARTHRNAQHSKATATSTTPTPTRRIDTTHPPVDPKRSSPTTKAVAPAPEAATPPPREDEAPPANATPPVDEPAAATMTPIDDVDGPL